MHYISDGCRKPKESAAAIGDEYESHSEGCKPRASVGESRSSALPADTIQKPKHKDRHKPGYMASYLRKWRRGEVGNKYKKEMDK